MPHLLGELLHSLKDEWKKERKSQVTRRPLDPAESTLHSPLFDPRNQSLRSAHPENHSDSHESPEGAGSSNGTRQYPHHETPKSAAQPTFNVPHPPSLPIATSSHVVRPSTRPDHDPVPIQQAGRAPTFRPPYEMLRNKMTQLMQEHRIGFMQEAYLPAQWQQSLTTKASIKDVFPSISQDLLAYIARDAPITFLITILTMQTVESGLDAMKAFQSHRFRDKECLPLRKPKYPESTVQEQFCTRNWTIEAACCNASCCSACIGVSSCLQHTGCMHGPELNAFHHSCWTGTTFEEFYRKQWHFLLQLFNVSEFQYDIDDDRILPFFMESESPAKRGNFSDVARASILASHLSLSEGMKCAYVDGAVSTKEGNMQTGSLVSQIRVAIKALKPLSHLQYNIHLEWRHEAAAHQALNELRHPHIVQGLAAFRQRNKYYLMLEWADGGSLQTYWIENQRPDFTPGLVQDVLEQLCGLVDALYNMHNTKQTLSRQNSNLSRQNSISSQVQVRDFQTQSDNQALDALDPNGLAKKHRIPEIAVTGIEEKPNNLNSIVPAIHITGENVLESSKKEASLVQDENWRHGDIKPDNILRFVGQSSDNQNRTGLGILKLADLGRAKQHKNVTKDRGPAVEIDMWHTKSYEPPDIFIYRDRTTSRLYDIWSLGCVFFEAIVWMLYGRKELEKYQVTTSKRDAEGSPYWTRTGRTSATVSRMASLWMDSILDNDPECNGAQPTAIHDLLKLVKDKMLVVNLPPATSSDVYEAGCRTNAKDVLDTLESIIQKARNDRDYLYTGASRKDVDAPPSGSKADAQLDASSQAFRSPSKGKSAGKLLAVPGAAVSARQTTNLVRPTEYNHPLTDAWSYVNDDAFAKATIGKLVRGKKAASKVFCRAPSKLCPVCSTLDLRAIDTFPGRLLEDLSRPASTECSLCNLLQKQAKKIGIATGDMIELDRKGGKLRLNNIDDSALRICRSSDAPDFGPDDALHVPIGFPKLPCAVPGIRMKLLREWLNDCDSHDCIPRDDSAYCPRRLLYIGTETDQCCRLVDTVDLGEINVQYIALSHPWGDELAHPPFKTTKDNIAEHMDLIEEEDLPQNFQDAIQTVRGLRVSYLWIDSICIRQASTEDEGDFRDEAEHMQDIFSSAYCVIAASSATGMTDGFLAGDDDAKVVTLPQSPGSGDPGQYYISSIVDDFDRDVEQGPLSRRGWAFQERALARRTIYFTDNQAYFECGQGVRCETLSKLKSDEASLLGDPKFPAYGIKDKNMGAQLFLFMSLYEHYSRLEFSHDEDKPIAIAGLEQRLTQSFADRSGAGMFGKHPERWLLWRRDDEAGFKSLRRIHFKSTMSKSPPTWSWMSYIGGIKFLQPEGGETRWNRRIKLSLTGSKKNSWLYAKDNLALRAPILRLDNDAAIEISASFSRTSSPTGGPPRRVSGMRPSLTMDDPEANNGPYQHFVLIGTYTLGLFADSRNEAGSTAYVLAVRPNHDNSAFERIGAGEIPIRMVSAGVESAEMFSVA